MNNDTISDEEELFFKKTKLSKGIKLLFSLKKIDVDVEKKDLIIIIENKKPKISKINKDSLF